MSESDPQAPIQHDLVSCLPVLANDYANFISVDASKEKQSFYNSIDEMLTRLDEFGGLVDTVRSDTSLCVDTNVKNIQAKCEEMSSIFARVDQLEAFIAMVHKNVNVMEECVNKAESEMGSFSGLKKIFTSLVGKKTSQQKDLQQFQPPDIFITEEYLRPSSAGDLPETGQLDSAIPTDLTKPLTIVDNT